MTTALFDSAWGPFAIALTVGCVVLVAVMVALSRPRGAWLRHRLDPYGRLESGAVAAAAVDTSPGWRPSSDRLFGLTERLIEPTRLWRATMRLLERAGSQMRPAELLWQCLLVGFGAGVLVLVVLGSPLLSVVALGLGCWVPWVRMKHRAHRRLRAFEDQLADVLMTMSGSLKVGLTFQHSVAAIVDEGQPPASEEFERMLNETHLGRPMDEALAAMGERIDSDDLRFVLMSVGIQREVGGSLAELFHTVSETVRERQLFRRKVRALTAMGRMSAYILVALPLVIALLVSVLSPGYMEPMWHTTVGHVLIAVMVGLTVIGALFLKRIVTIKG
jgi:tight adherence protein B